MLGIYDTTGARLSDGMTGQFSNRHYGGNDPLPCTLWSPSEGKPKAHHLSLKSSPLETSD